MEWGGPQFRCVLDYGVRVNANRTGDGTGPLTKADKRAAAKVARAKAVAAARRRRALSMGGAVVGVLAVIGIVVWLAIDSSGPSTTTSTATPTAAATEDTAAPVPTPTVAFPPVPADADPALKTKPAATAGTGTLSKLEVKTLVEGKGATTQAGQAVTVNYVGVTFKDGKEFDSSWSRSAAYTVENVGQASVIQGWNQGLVGVKVGSRIQLDIPPDLAYGDNPTGGQPAGPLRFIIDVLAAS